MELKRFKWKVLVDADTDKEFRIRSTNMGDGYVQVIGDGINTEKNAHKLSTLGRNNEMKDVMKFLDEHKGVMPFIWVHPTLGEGVYRCEKYSIKPLSKDFMRLSFSFIQAYI